MATRSRQTSLAAVEKAHPPPATLSDLQAQNRKSRTSWKVSRRSRLGGRPSAGFGYQQFSLRRTTPASPSKPVPKRPSVPGSGTTEDDPVVNPVREQLRPSRTPK